MKDKEDTYYDGYEAGKRGDYQPYGKSYGYNLGYEEGNRARETEQEFQNNVIGLATAFVVLIFSNKYLRPIGILIFWYFWYGTAVESGSGQVIFFSIIVGIIIEIIRGMCLKEEDNIKVWSIVEIAMYVIACYLVNKGSSVTVSFWLQILNFVPLAFYFLTIHFKPQIKGIIGGFKKKD